MQHRTPVRLRRPQRGTPVRFWPRGPRLLPHTASLRACQHPGGGVTPETGWRPSEWLCGRLRGNVGYAPHWRPQWRPYLAKSSNGEHLFDVLSPPYRPPEGPGGDTGVVTPSRPSQALRRALRGCERAPGGSPTRRKRVTVALDPGGPDHGREGNTPRGRWSAFVRSSQPRA